MDQRFIINSTIVDAYIEPNCTGKLQISFVFSFFGTFRIILLKPFLGSTQK